MKIIFLIPSQFANSVHVMKMCQAFAKNGHDVTLLAIRGNGYRKTKEQEIFNYYGVDACFKLCLFRTFLRKGQSLIYSLPSIKYLNRERPDLVYTRNLFTATLAVILGFKTIYETHSPKVEGGRFGDYLFTRIMKSDNLLRLVVISESLRNMLKDRFDTKKIFVAHDGADLQTSDNRVLEKQLLHRCRDNINVGYVGHLYPGRGIDIISGLAGYFHDVKFHIIGGLDKDILYWKTKISRENVIFHGFVPPKEIPLYLCEFDILLMPYQDKVSTPGVDDTSKWMSPLKMFEYMSSGKAIISSDHHVLGEVLTHEENALLVSPGNINEWKLALKTLIGDPGLRKRLGSKARKDLQDNYTWGQRAARVLEDVLTNQIILLVTVSFLVMY